MAVDRIWANRRARGIIEGRALFGFIGELRCGPCGLIRIEVNIMIGHARIGLLSVLTTVGRWGATHIGFSHMGDRFIFLRRSGSREMAYHIALRTQYYPGVEYRRVASLKG